MTIRIAGDGPKITATGSGSTVLVEISTGQHDPGSFSGVHNDLTGRSTTGAHVGTAVSIDPTGFAGNLDGTIVNAQLLAAAVDDLTTGGGGGGGVTDHGLLTGLSDDDHTQYAKKASNLSDLADAPTARTNLGLGTAAVAATGDFATAAQGVDARTPTAHKTSHENGGSDELALDASQITSGTVAQDRLGTGSAGAGAKFLADDQTYKTVTASETLAATIIDAKGDLIVGTADNTAARLAVGGTNGQTLTVSSGATPGVAWTAPGPPMVIPSGRYSLGGPWTTATAAATFMDAGYMIGTLMYLPPGQSFDRLGVLISASGASGATLRLGIYNIGSNGYPTTQLVAHSGTLNCGSGGLKEATVSFAGVGWCWGVWQTAGAAVSSRAPSPTPMQAPLYVAESHTTHTIIYAARSDAALPSDLTAQSWTLGTSAPHGIQVRAA